LRLLAHVLVNERGNEESDAYPATTAVWNMTDCIAHRRVRCQYAVSVVTNGQEMREGDIVVTRVARHYSLGRVKADGQTQTPIESLKGRSAALRRACFLAGAGRRVFILENPLTHGYRQFDCAGESALLPPDPS
jgi:hypothetical protein